MTYQSPRPTRMRGDVAAELRPSRRDLLLTIGSLPWIGSASAQESASGWRPTRPIRLIVPFPAGGGTDQVARIFADKLRTRLEQAVVVENRPGANGIIGTQAAFNAAPDGSSFLIGTIDTHAINSSLYPNLPYQAEAFMPVAAISTLPMVYALNRHGRTRSMRDLIEVGRNGSGNYGHWAVGSLSHLASELLKQQARIPNLVGIPYQGSGPALQALMAGQIDVMYMPLALARANPERIDILGLASPNRFGSAGDILTMAELGYPVDADGWVGLFAPPRTPKVIVEAMYRAASATIADPETSTRFVELGMSPQIFPDPEAYGAWIEAERTRWARVIRELGITLIN